MTPLGSKQPGLGVFKKPTITRQLDTKVHVCISQTIHRRQLLNSAAPTRTPSETTLSSRTARLYMNNDLLDAGERPG